jgi:hypothetical protein
MTSFRQIEANRRNALKSTGPKTELGRHASRRNAVRHGLTAETVIGALEDAQQYKAFEATITAEYGPQSFVEWELVLRLANLLWRLRRATTMETGLFEIQAEHLQRYRRSRQLRPGYRDVVHMLLRRTDAICDEPDPALPGIANATEALSNMGAKPLEANAVDSSVELARCFLRLANLPNFALDRLSRYEATLWRQVAQVLFALDALDRRKPHERRRGPARYAGACKGDEF